MEAHIHFLHIHSIQFTIPIVGFLLYPRETHILILPFIVHLETRKFVACHKCETIFLLKPLNSWQDIKAFRA